MVYLVFFILGIMVNCGLIGILGPVHRIFPDITPQQQVILIVVLEVIILPKLSRQKYFWCPQKQLLSYPIIII